MNKRTIVAAIIVLIIVPVWASATSIGISAGIDPTMMIMIGTVTEVPVIDYVGLRAQLSVAVNSGIAGLMTMNAAVCGYYPLLPFIPFIGLGGGIALTPSGFNWGWTLDALAGTHIAIAEPVSLFFDVHYIVRFSAVITYGPIYEGGISFSF
ncbi:hypothetical protein J7K60_01920 [Candidatus Bipolaricaulota bacterium]|nr:hypothetical protein [Candidatus Bipolaricaulota bacterium]HHR84786.1 hypothetical protein [Candidatus Acetothermia bacterium]